MTPQQEAEFNLYGCVSRSLINLAAAKGRPVPRDAFCQQFGSLFPANRYGMLAPSQIVDVIRGLGIGGHFMVFRRYAEIEQLFNHHNRGVLVFSEINLNAGATDVIRHCSLLIGINATGFSVLTPSQDGKDYPLPFTAGDWDAKLCLGLVV